MYHTCASSILLGLITLIIIGEELAVGTTAALSLYYKLPVVFLSCSVFRYVCRFSSIDAMLTVCHWQ